MKFDVVIIGGGRAGCSAAAQLCDSGLKVAIVSEGLSLSVSGSATPYARLAELQRRGVTVLRGDRAVGALIEDGRVKSVHTRNLGDDALQADWFVLATGKFFSRGLLSDKEHIWEPVFGADVEYDPDRSKWYDPDFNKPQPFMKYGVKTSPDGFVLAGGAVVGNLLAVGEIVAEGYPQSDLGKL